MIEAQFHPCDEATRFGFTAHGLASTGSDPALRAHGAVFPLPFEWPYTTDATERYDTHLLRVPGVEPVELPEAEAIIEAAAGRTWQHYAILAEDRLVLFGHALKGWVCIDPDGGRWLVRAAPEINMSLISIDQPVSIELSVTPFGELDTPAVDPVVITATLSDAGQNTSLENPPSGSRDNAIRQLRIGSISSTGRRAVIELHGVQSTNLAGTMRRNTAPAGYLMLELSGSGPEFAVSLSVLRTQSQSLGSFSEDRVRPPKLHIEPSWTTESTPRAGGLDIVTRPTGAAMSEAPYSDGIYATAPYYGAGYAGSSRTGRVAALIFDDADALIEFTYEATLRVDYSYPAPSFSGSGAITGWIQDGSTVGSTSSNDASAQMSRTSTEELTGEIVLRRNGVSVGGGVFSYSRTISESRTADWPSYLVRVDGEVTGPPLVQGWSLFDSSCEYSTVVSADKGAAQVAWDLPSVVTTGRYSLALWESLLQSVSFAYGATLDYGNTVGNDYAGATLQLQRYSNCVLGVLVTAKRGTKPRRDRVPALVAPQSTWINPATRDATTARQATYHPFTHEIFTDDSDGEAISQPFVWI